MSDKCNALVRTYFIKQIMKTGRLNLVEHIPCFAGLDDEAKDYLMASIRERSFAKGKIIILEGETCPGLFVVKSGSVKLYCGSMDGEEQIVRVVRRGECFECVPLFDSGTNPVSAQTLEASTLYFLPTADFNSLLNTYPRAALVFAPILARRLRSLVSVAGDFSSRRVYPRLARLLSQLVEPRGDALVISPSPPITQQDLACMLGCSRQTVNSWLRKLVRAGNIRMAGHRIIVLNPEALKMVVDSRRQTIPPSLPNQASIAHNNY